MKGYGSERSWVLLGTESLQTFGGSGFLQEYPIEQYVRDAKIDTLYEGTTAIQGQDFFFRKIVKDQGQALGHLAERDRGVRRAARPATAGSRSSASCSPRRSRTRKRIVGHMIDDLMSADPSAESGEIRNIYKVGLNTTRLLMVARRRRLRLAAAAPGRGRPGEARRRRRRRKDKAFYEGKVAAAQFFAQHNLPRISAERAIAEATDLSLMDLDEAAF